MGVWAARSRERRTTDSLLVAGRNMPLLLGVFTMTATWVGGGYINGTAEAVYTSGLLWAQAPWGYALSLLLGGLIFAVPMRRRGFTTLLDPFHHRYGRTVASLLFLPALLGEICWSSAILVALGTTFGVILEVDIPTAIVVSSAVAAGYTVIGGMWSIAYTDVLQLLLLLVGLLVAVPLAWHYVGDAPWQTYIQEFGAAARLFPSGDTFTRTGEYVGWSWLDMGLLLMLGGIPWQVYFQRVLSCRDAKTAVWMSAGAAVGCMFLAIPAGMMGLIGAVVDWSALGLTAPEGPMVVPVILRDLTPPLVALIGLGAIAAAVMASVDSSFLSASSMFTWNVYRPLIRPAASEPEIRWVVRCGVLGVATLSTCLAVQVQSIYVLWYLCSDLVYVILFPQLIVVLFVKRATVEGAMAGALVGLVLRVASGEPLLGIPALIPYPMIGPDGISQFPFRTTAMLTSLATIIIVSLWTSRKGDDTRLPIPAEHA